MLNEILQGKRLKRYIPFIGWITSYQRVWLRDEVASGIVGGAIIVPVAMAYAQMAGVPPQQGLYSAGIAIYAFSLALLDSLDSVLFDWAPFVRDNAIYTHTSMGLTT